MSFVEGLLDISGLDSSCIPAIASLASLHPLPKESSSCRTKSVFLDDGGEFRDYLLEGWRM